MLIPIRTFQGEFPRVKPHLLPDGASQFSESIDLARGDLSGLSDDGSAHIGPASFGVRGLYVHEGSAYLATTGAWYAWNRDVDVVRGPLVDDQYTRFYWSDGSGFFVSQAINGGYGSEPSGTNRFKVGVPKPSSAMTRVTTGGFVLGDVTAFAFKGFCEDATGARSHELALSVYSDTNITNPKVDTRSWMLPFDTSVCPVAPTATSSTATAASQATLTDKVLLIVDNVSPTGGSGIPAAESTINVPIYGPSGGSVDNSSIYFHWSDWEAAPLSATVGYTTPNGVIRTFYHVGNGWYSTDSAATAPNGGGSSATVSTVVSTTPAVEITMTRANGATVKAVLRQDSANNTWPAELFGYAAELEFKQVGVGSMVMEYAVITIRSRTDYAISRAYTYTYVNAFGEEGAPADPLMIDEIVEGQPVTVRYTPPAYGHGYKDISKIRVYRTATGSGGTEYLFVKEVSINSTNPTYVDDVAGDELGESCLTIDYLPPLQTLKGLVVLPNGIMAGYVANEIHLSEPYLPYAFKRSNIKTVPHNIVGLMVCESGLYAITTSYPYLLSGVTPDAMAPQKVTAIQGGVAQRAMCNVGPYAAYASNDGLVMLRGLDADLTASFKMFTREKWQEMYGPNLAYLRLAAHDGYILGWFSNGVPGFLLRLDEATGMTRVPGSGITAAHVVPQYDALYLARGTSISTFRKASSRKSWTWRSKDFILPRPNNFGAIQMVGSGYVTVQVYADGALVRTITNWNITPTGPEDMKVERLPSGFTARRWSLTISGSTNGVVNEVYLANSIQELKNA